MIVEMQPIVNCRNQSRLRTKDVSGTAKPQVAASANDRPKKLRLRPLGADRPDLPRYGMAIGCVAQAIVAGRQEIEDEPAAAVWLASGLTGLLSGTGSTGPSTIFTCCWPHCLKTQGLGCRRSHFTSQIRDRFTASLMDCIREQNYVGI
jgi:hypothetical protein